MGFDALYREIIESFGNSIIAYLLSPHASLIKVNDHSEYMIDKGILDFEDEDYQKAFNKGWVRVAQTSPNLYYQGKPTTKQLKELKDFAIERGLNLYRDNKY